MANDELFAAEIPSTAVEVARLDQIPAKTGLAVIVGELRLALFRFQGTVFAIDDRCSHMGASLGAGTFADGVVTCSWHGWRFRVTDGAWVSCPKVRNKCYPVTVAGNSVWVDIAHPF